jgi:hypothetical protein
MVVVAEEQVPDFLMVEFLLIVPDLHLVFLVRLMKTGVQAVAVETLLVAVERQVVMVEEAL